MKQLANLLELIFPSNIYCICCGSVIDRTRPYALCDRCVQKIHWVGKKTCQKCGKILEESYMHETCVDCRDADHLFEKGYTCARYGLYERTLMMDYKYHDKAWIGKKLGDILTDRMEDEACHPDLVIPVPIHPTRLAKRGYNQVELMAGQYAGNTGIPMNKRVLLRTKNTMPMRNLGAAERISNVDHAFAIRRGFEEQIKSKNILLIDDIYTTGSTADSCTQTLLDGGANKVWLLTFASGSHVISSNSLQ